MSESPSRFTPPSRKYDAYIFDCDGTLADSMPLHFDAWRAALRAAGATFEFTWDIFVSRAGMSTQQTVRELETQFSCSLDHSLVERKQRYTYQEGEKSLVAVPEVAAFLRSLETPLIAVASGSLRPRVEATLSQLEMRERFEVIVTPEDVERGKPHPDMFLLAAERLGVAPKHCLVLEDAEFGFEAASRAGMDCARVGPPRL